jgi:phospholipase C
MTRTILATFLFAAAVFAQSGDSATTTPIKHVVVIFGENISFDHYFGTYPNAANPEGEPAFTPVPNTPQVNGLTPVFLNRNTNPTAPFRLDRSQETTCDNDNHYADEQKAYNAGLLNQFPITSVATSATCIIPALNMGYYDGNSVGALWNYAQHYSLSDNFFDTEFGTTVMGHLNLISGQTHTTGTTTISGKVANGSVIANVEAGYDDCVTTANGTPVLMTGQNVGDLLNAKGVSWGWFYGDFPESTNSQPIPFASCGSAYNSHYDPFQYYKTTSNQHHLPPSSVAAIGSAADQANHQYSISDFMSAVAAGNIPAVVFLKATSSETGHPANSSPLQEQLFLVDMINTLMQTPEWSSMAILMTYDDSDGWYDHVMPPIVNQSNDPGQDALLGTTGMCGTAATGAYLDRCGYGTRLPFLVVSPYAKQNYVSHALTDTTSILRFIEDNWDLGRIGDQSFDAMAGSILDSFDFTDAPHTAPLILNPVTGAAPASTTNSASASTAVHSLQPLGR